MSKDFRVAQRPSTTPALASSSGFAFKRLRSEQIDRIAYREEAKAMVRKHRAKIEFLVQENNALKEKVIHIYQRGVSSASVPLQSNTKNVHVIQNLIEEIHSEQEALKTINEQIKIFKNQIFVEKQKMAGVHLNSESQEALVKTIKVLENRLDQATQKFNEQVCANTQLRNQINSFKKERTIFQKFSKKPLSKD